jgi:hypothetical protein
LTSRIGPAGTDLHRVPGLQETDFRALQSAPFAVLEWIAASANAGLAGGHRVVCPITSGLAANHTFLDERIDLKATTDNQRPLSDTAVLPPFGIPEPRLTWGSRVGEKDESATPFSIPIYFALTPRLAAFLAIADRLCSCPHRGRNQNIRPDCVLEFRQVEIAGHPQTVSPS